MARIGFLRNGLADGKAFFVPKKEGKGGERFEAQGIGDG